MFESFSAAIHSCVISDIMWSHCFEINNFSLALFNAHRIIQYIQFQNIYYLTHIIIFFVIISYTADSILN